jgi:hypothetical protein
MTTLPILGKHPCRLWPGFALEVNTFAGHDGGNRHSASSLPQCTSSVERQTRHLAEQRLPTIEKKKDMSTYQTHVDDRPTVHTQRNLRATDHGQLRSARPGRLDRSIQHVPAPLQPSSDPSTNGRKTAQSAAEVVGIRLLAILTVALFVTSIIGLTVFSQDGNSTTAIASGVIGISSALLGFIVGFHNAYRATTQ